MKVNSELLAEKVKQKRGNRGYRIAVQIPISYVTLSNIEKQKNSPMKKTLLSVCGWLNEKPETFILSE